MSDTTNNPQPADPPVNSGGNGGTSSNPEEPEGTDLEAIDPPVTTGGGGSA